MHRYIPLLAGMLLGVVEVLLIVGEHPLLAAGLNWLANRLIKE